MLDSGAEGLGFKSQSLCCRVVGGWQTVHTHCASVHQAAKLVAALLWVVHWRRNRSGRPSSCRTNNLTKKDLYVHIISTFMNVKWTKTEVEKMRALWSVDSREN